jgi:hypothetical protein
MAKAVGVKTPDDRLNWLSSVHAVFTYTRIASYCDYDTFVVVQLNCDRCLSTAIT